MIGIHLAAALTTLVTAIIFGAVIHKFRLPANERLVWLATFIALPLQPLVYYHVRVPLDGWLAASLGSSSDTYTLLKTLYAPLTEEAAKLLPLLVPAIFCDLRSENCVRYALAIGVGFAVGEMWFVADQIASVPKIASLPFYQFGGYAAERLMTCVFHSAFVSMSLWCMRGRFAFGFAGAVALHWLGNIPVFLMKWDVGDLGGTAWTLLVQGFLLLYLFAAAGLLAFLTFGKFVPARIFYGRRACPECHGEYEPPLMALNFGRSRYDRCPHCQRWHWSKPIPERAP